MFGVEITGFVFKKNAEGVEQQPLGFLCFIIQLLRRCYVAIGLFASCYTRGYQDKTPSG